MLIILPLAVAGGIPAHQGREAELAFQIMHRVFPGAHQTRLIVLPITFEEKSRFKQQAGMELARDSLEVIVAADPDTCIGYGVLDEVRGKEQPITYLVSVDRSLVIRDVDILAYRESYGGEVGNRSWLRQFDGKHPGDSIRPGKEIKSITGATISARAITMGVNRTLLLLVILHPRLPRLPADLH